MSLSRFAYYCAIFGGWAAFGAWLLAELLVLRGETQFDQAHILVVCSLVGAALGAAMNLVAGRANPLWKRQTPRVGAGLGAGLLGGALGALVGQATLAAGLPFALGWAVMGAAIGVADGLFERSARKIRNGLVGGTCGGLTGGLLFAAVAGAYSNVAGRALAFTILGLSIGGLVGLTHVALKEAWLTVLDGFRPGRELILTQPVTILGRGDHLPLPLLGYAGRDLEVEHARIVRRADGRFVIEDLHSRIGTLVNGRPIQDTHPLHDGDTIKLGSNLLRFRLRRGLAAPGTAEAKPSAPQAISAPPPPPVCPPAAQAGGSSAGAEDGEKVPPAKPSSGIAIPAPPSAVPASFKPKQPAVLPPGAPPPPSAHLQGPPLGGASPAESAPEPTQPAESEDRASARRTSGPRIPPPPPPPPPPPTR